MQPAIVAPPGEATVRLQMHMLASLGRYVPLRGSRRPLEAFGDAAELAVNVDVDVVVTATLRSCRMAPGAIGFSIEHGRKQFVFYLE